MISLRISSESACKLKPLHWQNTVMLAFFTLLGIVGLVQIALLKQLSRY
jgi:hypothetical protein